MGVVDAEIKSLAASVVALLQKKELSLATAESCTGGAVSQAITSVPGCSSVMKGAVVAYHNDVKMNVLGVSPSSLSMHGAVSGEVAEQMVLGVARLLDARCAIATTGVAGPGGGSPEKPVGTVWIAAKVGDDVAVKLLSLKDCGREANVKQTVLNTLLLIKEMLCRNTF